MDYNILGQMLFIALVFFWSGWQFRASRMEKQVISMNEKHEAIIKDIQSNIFKELDFMRLERDEFLKQQDEITKSLKAYNDKYLELKKEEKKEKQQERKEQSNQAKANLEALKQNKNSGLKK